MKKLFAVMSAVVVLQSLSVWAVQPGEAAPDFKAASTAGRELSLGDFAGKWLVLYFYPKSFTPGCTAESCSLRDGYQDIQSAGAAILGVSLDNLETQQKFKAEHKLPFELLSDENAVVAKAYDALGFGGFMAKRLTFIINPEGKVVRIIDSVKTGDHDAQVLELLRELQNPSAT
jgi:peroxiredoxin Q/BCP